MDFTGPFHGHVFLVIVDGYLKWLEIVLMSSTISEALIRALHRIFATHGLPDLIMSDNSPQLTSTVFESFLAGQGIRHALILPFHPAGNGLAERMVWTAKEALGKMGPRNWQENVDQFLLTQHTTPWPQTIKCPAEILMGRCLRTTLDRMHPSYSLEKPLDSGGLVWEFKLGHPVYARNYIGHPLWIPGKVAAVIGPCSYRVELTNGLKWKRHIDQLRSRGPPNKLFCSNGIPREGFPSSEEVAKNYLIPAPEPRGNLPINGNDGHCSTAKPSDSPVEPGPAASAADEETSKDGSEETSPAPETSRQVPSPRQELRRSSRVRRWLAYLQEYTCANMMGRSVTYSASGAGCSLGGNGAEL